MSDLMAVHGGASALSSTIQVSVKGKWVERPSLCMDGQALVVKGRLVRIASVHDEDYTEKAVTDPEAFIRALKDKSSAVRADIFAFTQREPDVIPHYSYPMEFRSIAVAKVGDYSQWVKDLPKSTRQNLRKAESRGVVLKVRGFDADVIQGICEVQNETPIRQGRPFTHYGKTFEQARRDHGSFTGHSDFICAYAEGEFIGFLKLVYRGDTASILQLLAKTTHYDRRTSTALLAKAVQLCSERGIGYMEYGLFNYGNKGSSSLREFKERHGFEEMLVPYYYVPITAWGRFCVRARLYRNLHDILPHGFIKRASELRAKWHEKRIRLAEQNSGPASHRANAACRPETGGGGS